MGSVESKIKTGNSENPDIEIRGLITDSTLYVGSKIAEINRSQFEERKVQHRPFFSPISLHPKVARALINLTSINRNQVFEIATNNVVITQIVIVVDQIIP